MPHQGASNECHKISFPGEIRNILAVFSWKKVPYPELSLSGPSCSKLTMLLVNIKTLIIEYGIYTNIFAEKM